MVKNIEILKDKMKTVQAIIFDMDGTLIDLENLNYSAYAKTVQEAYGLDLSKSEYHNFFSGTKTAYGFSTFLDSKEIKNYDVDALIRDFRTDKRWHLINNIQNTVSLRERTVDLLQQCKDKEISLALATSTIKEFTDIILDHFKLRKFFDVILTAEDVQAGKPDPFIYQFAAKKLSTDTANIIVFEDSLNGIQAAKNAGILCIGLYDKNWNHEVIETADVVIENFDEVIQMIQK